MVTGGLFSFIRARLRIHTRAFMFAYNTYPNKHVLTCVGDVLCLVCTHRCLGKCCYWKTSRVALISVCTTFHIPAHRNKTITY